MEATLLIVDDVLANRNLLRQTLEPHAYEVLLAPDGETALKAAERARPDLILLDVVMPGLDGYETCRRLQAAESTRAIPVIFITAKDETPSIVEGFRAGGVDYIAKPFQAEEVLARVRTHLRIHRLTQELRRKNEELQAEMDKRRAAEQSEARAREEVSALAAREAERWGVSGFVGKSAGFGRMIQTLQRAQEFGATSVLITGESGTGKELVARALHFGSPRAKGPFVAVNCSAIPSTLAESTFFGHLRGAFTGADKDRKGCFEQAHGGTLFLDEVGDMPLELQAKLLRVLEDGLITPVGATQSRKVEVRVVAATNAELLSEIEAGQFRRDLFFRLARFTIEVPPLRERREDIPLLAGHFLGQFATEMGMAIPTLSAAAVSELERYDFPGNIRELKNLVERALIESGGGSIGPEHLRFVASRPGSAGRVEPGVSAAASNGAPAGNDDQKILDYIKTRGAINNTECRDLLGVGMQRACYLLRKLLLAGVLQRDSSGRWAQYRLP